MGGIFGRRGGDNGASARLASLNQQIASMRQQLNENREMQEQRKRLEQKVNKLTQSMKDQDLKREEEKHKFELELQKKEAQYAQAQRSALQTQLALKIKLLEAARAKQSKLQKIVTEIAKCNARQLAEIQAERQRLNKLNFKAVENGSVFVLLGKTGVGKSTFTNRLYGDTSRRADKGPAKTSSATVSCTTDPEIIKCDFRGKVLHVVDSGGFADTEGRDIQHANNLCEFLNGCGGINAFVLLLNSQEPRMTAETINAVLGYEKIFGNAMYKQLLVVATRVDKGENLEDYREDNIGSKLRDCIATKLKLHEKGMSASEIKALPVIPIGRQHYQPALEQMDRQLQTRARNKFGTTELRSPLSQMQGKQEELMSQYKKQQTALSNCAQGAENLSREVDGLRNAINTCGSAK